MSHEKIFLMPPIKARAAYTSCGHSFLTYNAFYPYTSLTRKRVLTKQMKRIFVLLLFSVVFCNSLHAFSLSVGSNHVKISQTTTVTVGDISGSPTDYHWSSNIGTITGSGSSVTFNAPATKGKATISVTVKNGATTLWSGTAQVLVYKSIIIIKTDDYYYCKWNTPSYIYPNYKAYIDYMVGAHVKTSVGLNAGSALSSTVDVTGAFADVTKAYLNTGYVEIYNHSYSHDCQTTKSLATLNTELQNCEDLAFSKLGIHLRGFGPPGACVPGVNADLVTALNNLTELKYAFQVNGYGTFNGFLFTDADNRINCESRSFVISLSQLQSEYTSKKDRPVNYIQIHPVWWGTSPGTPDYATNMAVWQQIIAYLKADGATIILPYDYVRMVNEPAFVPDEDTGGSSPTDTTPPQ